MMMARNVSLMDHGISKSGSFRRKNLNVFGRGMVRVGVVFKVKVVMLVEGRDDGHQE